MLGKIIHTSTTNGVGRFSGRNIAVMESFAPLTGLKEEKWRIPVRKRLRSWSASQVSAPAIRNTAHRPFLRSEICGLAAKKRKKRKNPIVRTKRRPEFFS